jgi:hypothetical protein
MRVERAGNEGGNGRSAVKIFRGRNGVYEVRESCKLTPDGEETGERGEGREGKEWV